MFSVAERSRRRAAAVMAQRQHAAHNSQSSAPQVQELEGGTSPSPPVVSEDEYAYGEEEEANAEQPRNQHWASLLAAPGAPAAAPIAAAPIAAESFALRLETPDAAVLRLDTPDAAQPVLRWSQPDGAPPTGSPVGAPPQQQQ